MDACSHLRTFALLCLFLLPELLLPKPCITSSLCLPQDPLAGSLPTHPGKTPALPAPAQTPWGKGLPALLRLAQSTVGGPADAWCPQAGDPVHSAEQELVPERAAGVGLGAAEGKDTALDPLGTWQEKQRPLGKSDV